MSTLLDRLPRPLDPFRSFKVKVALLVGLSLLASSLAFWAGSSWPFRYALVTSLLIALAVTQLLAHGMTSPLREMTSAAKAMTSGRYDITVRASSRDEIGELAVAFNQMSADLAASDRYRRELIANVSHELRTPIAALQAVLENVVDGVEEADRATLAAALRQTERLGTLVTELLDLSRLDGGVLPLRKSQLRVLPFLEDAASGTVRRVPVRVDVVPKDLTVDADPARLHQVLTNLLDNAVRHSPAGGEVLVRARPLEGRPGLCLDVVDAGPGIAAGEQSRVFERFTRGGADDGGTGLGLAIARWAVELHGGTIAVVGAPPGCCIRVLLPAP